MSEVINLNRTTPAAEAGYVLGRWQRVTTPSSTDPTSGQPVFATSVELANVGGATPKTANYTAVAADCGTLLSFNSGSAVTLTLPATPPPIGTAPTNLWKIAVANIGTGVLTISPNGLDIDGAATSLTLNQGTGIDIFTDGTNYFTVRGAAGTVAFGGVSAKTANYTAVAGDSGQLISFTSSGAVTLTLPAMPPSAKWFIAVQNVGAGVLTVSPNGLDLDGVATSLTLNQNQGVLIYTDGTNYFTERGVGFTSPLTTKGDLYGHSTVDARIPVGADGTLLTADSTQTLGLAWKAQPYDVTSFLAGNPVASGLVLGLTFARAVNFLSNFSGSVGTVGTNPTASAVYTVKKNGSSVGTVAISTAGAFTFSTSGAVSFASGDRMTITAPTVQDATLGDVAMTLAGTR